MKSHLRVLHELEVNIPDFGIIPGLIGRKRNDSVVGRVYGEVSFLQALPKRPIIYPTIVERAVFHPHCELFPLPNALVNLSHIVLSNCFHFLCLLVVQRFKIMAGNFELHLDCVYILQVIIRTRHFFPSFLFSDAVHSRTSKDFEP